MEKVLFNKIINDLDIRINQCSKFDNLTSKESILNLSIKEFIDLQTFSRAEQGRMDKIVCDLYHLIGMGNLTVRQNSTLCSRLKIYLKYRSDIKYLASVQVLNSALKFPQDSDYTTYLGQVKLHMGPRDEKS